MWTRYQWKSETQMRGWFIYRSLASDRNGILESHGNVRGKLLRALSYKLVL